MRNQDKFRGCLIGGAAGDALGYAVEFMREDEIFRKYGEDGITEYDLRNGTALISDDTRSITADWSGEITGEIFSGLLDSDFFDYIFVGHTHRKSDRMMGKTRVINPGAIGGAHRGERGFCILDFATGELTDYVTE